MWQNLQNQNKKDKFKNVQMENMPQFTEKHRILVIVVRLSRELTEFPQIWYKTNKMVCIILRKHQQLKVAT